MQESPGWTAVVPPPPPLFSGVKSALRIGWIYTHPHLWTLEVPAPRSSAPADCPATELTPRIPPQAAAFGVATILFISNAKRILPKRMPQGTEVPPCLPALRFAAATAQ